jgi:predicted dehydrogenase
MVRAARKYERQVQMGNQRRSWPAIMEMIEKLRTGAIGSVFSARCWYSGARASIGKGKQVPVPNGLDYALWQGPAPARPYVDNLVHYNWHWRWHWGGGELANNGIHALDLARWGLGVNFPARVTYNGGRYHFDDDQETPDTGVAVYDFGDQCATWDCSSCHPRSQEDLPFVAFYGEGGTIENRSNGYVVYDETGKKQSEGSGPGGDAEHFLNFIDAVRGKAQLNAEIGDGQISTLLCHLGNIAYRAQGALRVDPKTGRVPPDANTRAAQELWTRQYQPGWEPEV